jgi:hypothetical protein
MLDILLQTFADLRAMANAAASDDERLESALSTAEQIGVVEDAVLHGQFFGAAPVEPDALARSLVGTLVRRIPEDLSDPQQVLARRRRQRRRRQEAQEGRGQDRVRRGPQPRPRVGSIRRRRQAGARLLQVTPR